MPSMLYIVTHDPNERLDLVSGVVAQAITALSFGYDTEIYLMDRAVNIAQPGYVNDLKSESFASLQELISMFAELEGKLYVCAPFAHFLKIDRKHCIPEVTGFVDAGRLVVRAKDSVVFTF